MQELLYVQFLEAELQTQLKLNESLEQKLSQDSQILHNIIDIETRKTQKLQNPHPPADTLSLPNSQVLYSMQYF